MYIDVVWIQYLVWYNDRHDDGNGFDGVLFAYFETPLGRVPKQVLQGLRLQVRTIQFRPSFSALTMNKNLFILQ